MANSCYFTMKLLGSKEALEEFAKRLDWQNPFQNDGIGRVSSFEAEPAEPSGAKGLYTIEGAGDCDWSIYSAMQERGLTDKQKESGIDVQSLRSLEEESSRLHVAVEAYSSEPGIGFQEHILIVDGEVLLEDCVDYEEYFIENVEEDLSKINKVYRTAFTEQDINHNGEITLGGFGEAFGDFRLLESMAQEYESLRDMDALRKGDVEIAPQPDGTIGFFFADTSVIADVSFQGEYYALKNARGDQAAHGEWNDLGQDELRLYGMEIAKHVPADKIKEALSQNRNQSLDDLVKQAKDRAAAKKDECSESFKANERKSPETER